MESKFEYKVISVNRAMSVGKMISNMQSQLDEMSADGWDLHVTALEGVALIFRRAKPEPQS